MIAQSAVAAVGLGLPSVAPDLRARFGLSLAALGVLLASSHAGALLGPLPWGVLADRLGERRVVGGGLAGAAAALVAAAFTDTATALGLSLFAVGLLGSAANVGGGRAVAGWFAREQRGFALGLRHTATPLGAAVAAATLPVVVSTGGLSAGFLVLAGFAALASGVSMWLLRPAPQVALAPPVAGPTPFRDSAIWTLSAGSGLVVLAQIAILTFLTVYLTAGRGWSAEWAAAVFALLLVAGATARIVAGAVSDRVGHRVRMVRRLALAAGIAAAVAALVLGAPDALAVPALLVAGTLSMSGNGVSFAAAVELAGLRRAGTALGLQNTVLAVAVVISPPLFGLLVAAVGWQAAFGLLALPPLAGALVLSPLARLSPRPG